MIQSSTGKILFIVAHPFLSKSRANAAVVRAVSAIPEVRLHMLYDRYPYFHIDIAQEQQLLRDHDLVVIQHPFYWYSMPALLKLWLDDVLESGWAYGPGGDKLKNKQLLVSLTVGGPEDAYSSSGYNRFPMETFLAPWDQTANLCHMKFLEPSILHGAIRASNSQLEEHAQNICRRLQGWLKEGGRA